jgi:hypothetical protein
MAILYLLVQLPHLIHEKKIKYCFVPHNSLSCTSVWWLSLFILQSPHPSSLYLTLYSNFCGYWSYEYNVLNVALFMLQLLCPLPVEWRMYLILCLIQPLPKVKYFYGYWNHWYNLLSFVMLKLQLFFSFTHTIKIDWLTYWVCGTRHQGSQLIVS